jgi:hypothetical protein
MVGVMDARAARGMLGVMAFVWGAAKVGKAGDEGAAEGQAVRSPRVAVGPPTSIQWAV